MRSTLKRLARGGASKVHDSSVQCSCTHVLTTNALLKGDPTRTLTLRKSFEADMARRFRILRRLIWESVAVNDCFGLIKKKEPSIQGFLFNQAIPPKAFAFKTSSQKIDGFMAWLQDETDKHILNPKAGLIVRRGPLKAVTGGQGNWTDLYIESGYKKGIARGSQELKKAGIGGAIEKRAIDSAFFAPVHADSVGNLYTRTFNELKGITNAMDQQISRSLAEGLAEGRNPRQIARILMNRIEKVGELATTDSLGRFIPALRRARTLARTEIIRAHHTATINSYASAGLEGVRVKAEWSTAGDDRVCPICESMEGKVFKLDVAMGMIPAHPNCRCVAIPAEVKVML